MFRELKNRVKEKLYDRVGISFNPYGVPFTLAKYLRDRSNISLIDIGAHQGSFTRAIDRLCGISRGVLVELQPAHAARLRDEFPPPRFKVVQAAVSDRAGELEVEINSFDATTSILKTKRNLPELAALDLRAMCKVTSPMVMLDTIFHEAKLCQVDLLKLDVQGAEHLVIGAERPPLKTLRWYGLKFRSSDSTKILVFTMKFLISLLMLASIFTTWKLDFVVHRVNFCRPMHCSSDHDPKIHQAMAVLMTRLISGLSSTRE